MKRPSEANAHKVGSEEDVDNVVRGEGLLQELLEQGGRAPEGGFVTINDREQLSREMPLAYAVERLTDPLPAARRDAALVLAFYGTAGEVAARP